jgi:hypothetical protein
METGKEPPYDQIAEWARGSRKELEPYLWRYKQPVSVMHQSLNMCSGNRCSNKSGGEVRMAIDPILDEVASQICSSGICLGAKGKGRLPICSAEQARKLEDCILDVKEKIKETGYKGNPYAICRANLGCRRGGSRKYEARVA